MRWIANLTVLFMIGCASVSSTKVHIHVATLLPAPMVVDADVFHTRIKKGQSTHDFDFKGQEVLN